MSNIKRASVDFLKRWTLPVSIIIGIIGYLVYHWTPALGPIGPWTHEAMVVVQPWLIFVMLFLQFNKISPHDLKLAPWHLPVLILQIFAFAALCIWSYFMADGASKIIVECAMLCFITPTAAAAGVITERLGGVLHEVMVYVIISNCVAALILPAVIPIIHPAPGQTFMTGFMTIVRHTFPMLIVPCFLAWAVRYGWRKLQIKLMRLTWMAFYIWTFSLAISLCLVTRSIILSHTSFWTCAAIGITVLAVCMAQFILGRMVGTRLDTKRATSDSAESKTCCVATSAPAQATASENASTAADGPAKAPKTTSMRASAGQSFGQKNSTFLIWLGYTFFNPLTSVAGGFYAVWQNIINSWELYKKEK